MSSILDVLSSRSCGMSRGECAENCIWTQYLEMQPRLETETGVSWAWVSSESPCVGEKLPRESMPSEKGRD